MALRALLIRTGLLIFVLGPCLVLGEPTNKAYLNTRAGAHYVGSKACAPCHESIYHSYSRTLMGHSMQSLVHLAGAPQILPVPSAPVIVHSTTLDRSFSIARRDSTLFQSEFQLASDGSKVFEDVHPLVYAIGAGENGIGYLIQIGNRLFEAPLSYYTRAHSWELSPGYSDVDFGFLRPADSECIACHSGRSRPASEGGNEFKDPPFEQLAVGCENCHGPGSLHIEQRMKGLPVKGSIDYTIVNPADLSPALADNVCMICHQAGDARVLQAGKSYADFRPGTPLNQTLAILAVPFTRASPPSDPLLQQYTQMILSKCYRASLGKPDGGLRCITCHDPHVQPDAAAAPAYFRQKCLRCHTEQSCTVPLTARLSEAPPDNCIGCHMPRQNLEGISHSALTNHRIVAFAGEPFPEAAFHMASPALPDLVYVDGQPGKGNPPLNVLFQAYAALAKTHPQYVPQYQRTLRQMAAAQPNEPAVLSALGNQEAASGTPDGLRLAAQYLNEAIQRGSSEPTDFEAYSGVLMRLGRSAEAEDALKRGIDLNPGAPRLYRELASIYLNNNQFGKAQQIMKQELAVYPEDFSTREVLSRLAQRNP